ncbi:MAG: MBL fold metallo-hydrolase [Deinococcales bacterium]
MKQLSKNIFQFTLGYSNIYLLRHYSGLTLVDAATPKTGDKIIGYLKQANFDLHDIKRIIITHAHPDHIGSVDVLQARTGAEVWAHGEEALVIRGQRKVLRPQQQDLGFLNRLFLTLPSPTMPKVSVQRELKDAELLAEAYEGLEVVHLPGHSPGQIGLWIPSEQLLIGGDVMMNVAGRLTQPIRAFTPNPQEARRSIEKVGRMKLEKLALGHGPAILSGADAKVGELLRRLERQKQL